MLFSNDSVAFREKVGNEYVREADGAWKIKRQTRFEILVSFFQIFFPPPRKL